MACPGMRRIIPFHTPPSQQLLSLLSAHPTRHSCKASLLSRCIPNTHRERSPWIDHCPTRQISHSLRVRNQPHSAYSSDPASDLNTSTPSSQESLKTEPISTPLPPPPASPLLCIHSLGAKRNSSAWTSEDDSLLLSLRSQGRSWQHIGQSLGRSRQACNRRFDAVLDPERGKSVWTAYPELNQALKFFVSQGLGWNEIAVRLDVKASACEKQFRVLQQQVRERERQPIAAAPDQEDQRKRKADRPTDGTRFNAEDARVLKAAVAEYGVNQWEIISKLAFGSFFNARQLRYQHTQLERKRRIWRIDQEEQLVRVVASRLATDASDQPQRITLASEVDTLSDNEWDTVASEIQGDHTGEECRKKWLKLQLCGSKLLQKIESEDAPRLNQQEPHSDKPTKVTGRKTWSAEQSQQLEDIIHSMKSKQDLEKIDWHKASEQMGGVFSPKQCKSRWTRLCDQTELSKHGPWDSSELQQLFTGLAEVGPAWTEINRKWLPGRSSTFIQTKWNAVVYRLSQDKVIHRMTWTEACVEAFGPEMGSILHKVAKRWPNICIDNRHE
ncbi:hypothetical protein BG011_003845 [Mortierella polycephala]|uniref:Myb-like domain-containing protein n=1 Tax=Mortierella polycephala TaxID=41804 RepID=A0A9P6Q374_9FUNG|nr:hypothetical protein BG011_003845 [Mortierella polycephala]